MESIKFLILGGGPSGLSFAQCLKQMGEESFLLLEKEETAGGLCRSVIVDGSPLDIGGGHFLDVRRERVNEFLFHFMPREEWDLYKRDSRIKLKNNVISHPMEANIWQFDLDKQVEYLSSISKAGCNMGKPMPDRFKDWIKWKLGDEIAGDYMLPYNKKMFADELDELGTYWLEKLPNVSFEETLLSCLTHRAYGTEPGHSSFYYPKKSGYGEVWKRMADDLFTHIQYGENVVKLDCENKTVTTASNEVYRASYIVTTIPWNEFQSISGMSDNILNSIGKLKTSALEIRYVPEQLDTEAQWIYVPDEDTPYHRILVRHNFCKGSRGYWLETRKERVNLYEEDQSFRYVNDYAYPLNTVGKPEMIKELLEFCRSRNIYGLGRWGEHSHYNSDVTVELAMNLAEKLT